MEHLAAVKVKQEEEVVGFRKVSPDRWEFAHADFLAGQRHLLANIRRRRGAAGGSYKSAKSGGDCEKEEELERLRREREALARELTRLRREQQAARAQLRDVARRVRSTERRQEQCTAFLARAVGAPAAPPVETARKRRRIDAGAAPAAVAEDVVAFVDLDLGADADAEVETTTACPSVMSVQSAGGATSLEVMWNELLGEEMVPIDGEEEVVGDAVEPWEEMGEEEVLELMQQIDCLASPGC
nr:unnamed protein product [Digitaria exilis]